MIVREPTTTLYITYSDTCPDDTADVKYVPIRPFESPISSYHAYLVDPSIKPQGRDKSIFADYIARIDGWRTFKNRTLAAVPAQKEDIGPITEWAKKIFKVSYPTKEMLDHVRWLGNDSLVGLRNDNVVFPDEPFEMKYNKISPKFDFAEIQKRLIAAAVARTLPCDFPDLPQEGRFVDFHESRAAKKSEWVEFEQYSRPLHRDLKYTILRLDWGLINSVEFIPTDPRSVVEAHHVLRQYLHGLKNPMEDGCKMSRSDLLKSLKNKAYDPIQGIDEEAKFHAFCTYAPDSVKSPLFSMWDGRKSKVADTGICRLIFLQYLVELHALTPEQAWAKLLHG